MSKSGKKNRNAKQESESPKTEPVDSRDSAALLRDAEKALSRRQFGELEGLLGQLSTAHAKSPEALSLRFQLHLGLREFKQAKTVGVELLSTLNGGNGGRSHAIEPAQLHNLLGLAHYECEEYSAAEKNLFKAIELKPDFPEAYISLSRLFRHKGDTERERRVLSDGLVRCTEKDELQMLANRFLGEETISLCMIVKNEEEFLPRCLDSVKDVVDEIIIVDTGSDDRTVEIAESCGAKVYHHPWENSFSLHRNQSLSYATCDWMLILDADEELERADIAKLKTATRIPDINVISVSVLNKNLKTSELTSFLPSMRLWRRKLDCHYESIVHNELRIPEGEPVLRADIRIYHYGYSLDWDKQKQKVERTRKLLESQLAQEPDNPFANFNYSQLLRGESRRPDAETCNLILDHSGRTLANTDPTKRTQRYLHVSALEQMSAAYFYLQQFDDAERCVRRALEIDPDYIDARFDLGHIYAARRDFTEAISAYNDYIEFANNFRHGDEADSYILQHTNRQPEAYYAIGMIYERLEKHDEAITNFNKVLEYKSDHLDLHSHLAQLYLNRGDLEQARLHAEQRVVTVPVDSVALFVLGEVARRQGDTNKARSYFEKLTGDNPNRVAAIRALADLEEQDGEMFEAKRWRERLQAIDPTAESRAQIESLMEQGNYSEAAQLLTDLVERFPEDADLQNDLGNCYFKQDDLKSAATQYDKALELNPKHQIALRNLGLCLFRQNQPEAAVEYLTRYLDLNHDDHRVMMLSVKALMITNRFADAIPYLEKLLRIQPDSPELLSLLSDCYCQLGHLESAYMGYRRVLAIAPNYEPALQMIARLEKLAADAQQLEESSHE